MCDLVIKLKSRRTIKEGLVDLGLCVYSFGFIVWYNYCESLTKQGHFNYERHPESEITRLANISQFVVFFAGLNVLEYKRSDQ